jgi:hypothetical protein
MVASMRSMPGFHFNARGKIRVKIKKKRLSVPPNRLDSAPIVHERISFPSDLSEVARWAQNPA